MPRYFFNLRNDGFVPDMVGKELADDDVARTVAWELARFLPKGLHGGSKAILVVADASGRTICEVQILG
jgi:hypothetical protein